MSASPVLEKLELRSIKCGTSTFQALSEKLATLDFLQSVILFGRHSSEEHRIPCFMANCSRPSPVLLVDDMPADLWRASQIPGGLRK